MYIERWITENPDNQNPYKSDSMIPTSQNEYERNGILLGDNLIITMESEKQTLNVRLVEEKIKRFCL